MAARGREWSPAGLSVPSPGLEVPCRASLRTEGALSRVSSNPQRQAPEAFTQRRQARGSQDGHSACLSSPVLFLYCPL